MKVARPFAVALTLAATVLATAPLAAASWTVDPERSTFAVLTHKAGVAAKLAHDHLVIARQPACTLDFDPASPGAARLQVTVPVLALEIDADAARAAHAARLTTLGALTEPFKKVDDGDRKKIREAMLSPGQLFAERFPEVRARLVTLEPRGGGEGGARVALGWNAKVEIEIRGEKVTKVFPARFEVTESAGGPELTGEVLGELKFTEFGIEPYSAVLGAVKNADLFHLWVSLVATPAR